MSLNLIKCYQTQGYWYNNAGAGVPVGVCWHDTGAGNPNLKRYVQPSTNDANYTELLAKIGKNTNNNDWNRASYTGAGLNAWIGKLADGSVAAVQAGPWDKRAWGVGKGSKGSLNGNGTGSKFWIQFEICDDYASGQSCSKDYFTKAYNQAVELTAYLCKLYGFDPHGTVSYNGVNVPTILCHADSCKLGLGSNHGDVYTWFNKFGKTMDDVRNDVAALLKAGTTTNTGTTTETPAASTSTATTTTTTTSSIKAGDKVSIKSDATYYNGGEIPSWVAKKQWIVKEVSSDRAVIDKSVDGKNSINSPINVKYLSVVGAAASSASTASSTATNTSFKVKIESTCLNIRKGPGTNYARTGAFTGAGIFTIVETKSGTGSSSGWGKLKSGAGWISLDYTKRV